jgi:hypothetical protein
LTQKLFLPIFVVIFFWGCKNSQPSKPVDNYNYTQIGEITAKDMSEISGIALSQQNAGTLWVINDSGNDANLYALFEDGITLATVKIKGADNKDWEDLAAFSENDVHYVLIADTGGNTSNREKFDIYIVKEPKLSGDAAANISLDRQITFRYEDEARDCEAAAVDVAHQKIYLLSKRSVPAVLYELPLHPNNDDVQVAKRLSEMTTIPQPTKDEIQNTYDEFHAQPTSMDIAPAGDKITVLTYRRLFIWDKAAGETWVEAMKTAPTQIEFPEMEQAEAISFYRDGVSVLVTSEHVPAPIYQIKPSASL